METIGPRPGNAAMGPLRRLVWAREARRPALRGRFFLYATPLALIALVGLGAAAGEYLLNNRDLAWPAVWLIAAGSVIPAAVTYRRPVLAWRLAFVMEFAGVANMTPKEAWPWNPVQIFCLLLVLARLAATQSSGITVWATGFSLVPLFLYAPRTTAGGAAVLFVAVAALGDIASRRRRTRLLLAEQTELTEAERARRAQLEERARIAREMHDVVAHHMSMIAVRAETAPYRVSDLSEPARAELASIADAARSALTDMRRLLGVLRSETPSPETAPQPGLADIAALVETARAAGLEVDVRLEGLDSVPDTVGLAAYRILQEALANAARHAPDGPVSLAARGFSDRLELDVRNPLPAVPRQPKPGGHGLPGMRERASLLGGTLSAERRDAMFVVHALLPFDSEGALVTEDRN